MAFTRQPHDLGVHQIPPSRLTDIRVPLAEEFALNAEIVRTLIADSRQQEWHGVDTTVVDTRSIEILGKYRGQIYPGELEIGTTIQLQALPDTTSIVKRSDRVYLITFTATIGSEHDPALGQVDYQYLDPSSNTIKSIQKENSLRDRAFWVLAVSSSVITSSNFYSLLPVSSYRNIASIGQLNIANSSEAGFDLGSLRIYARDPRLTVGAAYPINEDGIEVTEICQVRRIQNYTDRGYTWGINGEYPLTAQFCLVPSAQTDLEDLDSLIRQRVQGLFSGTPGLGGVYERTVQNLTAGQYGGNPGRPGEAAASPNGSVCLANSQRVTFTNQAFTQTTGVYIVTAASDNSGNPYVSISLNTNVPSGSIFSENPSDHKIWSSVGSEESALGSFVGLGGSGVLTWVGSQNSVIRPGQQVYVQPAIKFAPGSGFSVPFASVEQAWINGIPISAENIVDGAIDDFENDSGAIVFREPANSEQYLLVFGKERSALHYVYKRVNFTSDATGMITIPPGEAGAIAIVQGVGTRIDAPIYKGLAPNSTVPGYIYYPPRSTEIWQFQFSYPGYEGTSSSEPTFLQDSIVVSQPYLYLTTQGSGNSVFQGDAAIRYSPISLHLPIAQGDVQYYELDAPVRLSGESTVGALTYREGALLSGSGLALPSPGDRISIDTVSPSGLVRTAPLRLKINGNPVGFRSPILTQSAAFQAILVFAVAKGSERRLVVATRTGRGGESIPLDASQGVAIDTFKF